MREEPLKGVNGTVSMNGQSWDAVHLRVLVSDARVTGGKHGPSCPVDQSISKLVFRTL